MRDWTPGGRLWGRTRWCAGEGARGGVRHVQAHLGVDIVVWLADQWGDGAGRVGEWRARRSRRRAGGGARRGVGRREDAD